jgi:6-phosphogluconolactonase
MDLMPANVYKDGHIGKALPFGARRSRAGFGWRTRMSVAAGQTEIVVCPDAAALAVHAADRIVAAATSAISHSGRFTLVLSGGSTPERTYTLLAQSPRRQQIDWSRTWLFFGDERFVPHDDPRSNYHMAEQSLLKPAAIDPAHVLAISTNFETPGQCASQYESWLRKFFNHDADKALPEFDLALLGLGDDGHTASLFPGKPSLDEQRAWVTWSTPGTLPPPVDRITFTFPSINAAREVMFLVSGAAKAEVLYKILEIAPNVHKHPASGVRPAGKLIWLIDEPAAKLLNRKRADLRMLNSKP